MIVFSIAKWLSIGAAVYLGLAVLLYWLAFRSRSGSDVFKAIIARLNGYGFVGAAGSVLQSTDADCGAASVEVVLRQRGIELDERRLYGLRASIGTSMLDLRDALAAFGVQSNGVVCDGIDALMDVIKRGELAIVNFDVGYVLSPSSLMLYPLRRVSGFALRGRLSLFSHWVVFESVTPNGYLLVRDPYLGSLLMSPAQCSQAWNGHALVTSSS